MNWYVVLDGQQTGPLSDDRIRQLVQNGQIQHRDWIWNEALPQWVHAGTLPELFESGELPDEYPDPNHDRFDAEPRRYTALIAVIILLIIALSISAVVLAYRLFSPQADAPESNETALRTFGQGPIDLHSDHSECSEELQAIGVFQGDDGM